MNRMILWLIPALALTLLTGCIFSPKKDGGGGKQKPPPVYPLRDTPRQALQNMLTAYEARDSAQYLAVFAGDYEGRSYSVFDTLLNQQKIFTRDDEERHIKSLAQSQDIIRISYNFGPMTTWAVFDVVPGGPRKEIVIYSPSLELDFATESYLLKSNEILTYRFSPDYVSAAPDTIWSIDYWSEDTQ